MKTSEENILNEMLEYNPPAWCEGLKIQPKYRIPLAVMPTPIHPWKIEDVPEDFQLHVKRDDLTGSILSGNKVRNMEFILADAKAQGCNCVITSGTTQSNHARTTAIAARQVGLESYLLLVDKHENCKDSVPSANFLLIEAAASNVYVIPWSEYTHEYVTENEKILTNHIRDVIGKLPYFIPLGGNSLVGLHGYLYAWEEMLQQNIQERFDDVVVPTGTSGTVASLGIANYLTGSKLRIHGIAVGQTKKYILNNTNEMLKGYGIDKVQAEDIVDIIDEYLGGGYEVFGKEDVAHHLQILRSTGIYCDPVYVGKAISALTTELKINPSRFKGKRILFIHTGGLFNLMRTDVGEMIHDEEAVARIKHWKEVFPNN